MIEGFAVDGDKGTGLTQKWVTVIVSQTKRTGGRGAQTSLVFQTLGSLIQRNRDVHPYRWSWGSKHGEIKKSGIADNSHQYSQSSGGRSWVIFREIAGSCWQNLPSSEGQPSVCCSHRSSASLSPSNSHMIPLVWQNAVLKLPAPVTDEKV